MQIFYEAKLLQQTMMNSAQEICLVPTMGALHDGHLALIHEARRMVGENGCVAVSLFVNPMQFDRKEDLDHYPRPVEKDLEACQNAKVDVVFVPTPDEMYAKNHSIVIAENALSQALCGASRPGHFAGVCTVVMKLFQIFQCHSAIFGEKDFQQLAIIRRMVRDLNLPVKIIEHATIREVDGLAMSSRNARLSAEHRADAPRIWKALTEAKDAYQLGERNVDSLMKRAMSILEQSPYLRIDYLSLVDEENLSLVETIADSSGNFVLAFAGFYGSVRLIDHVTLSAQATEM